MNDTGQDMRATLLAGSADMPPGIDLLRGVREHAGARPRRRRRRMLVSAGAVAVAGGVAAAATLLTTSVTNPPSALAAVTSAVAKTTAQSYRFTLSEKLQGSGSKIPTRGAITGAIDPRSNLGVEQLTARTAGGAVTTAQVRFVGKYVYTWLSPNTRIGHVGKPWDKAPAPPSSTQSGPLGEFQGVGADQPISPALLLGVLRSATTVRKAGPASGPGWTGTKYAFSAHITKPQPRTISGTAYVDQQGRVRGLATTIELYLPEGSRAPAFTITDDLTFGDFGSPVSATAPPASQVEYTSVPQGPPGFGF